MDQPGSSAAAELRKFLRSGPDFDPVELSRARGPGRVIDLHPAAQGVDES